MGDSSGGTETATQNSEPWSQSQPYLRDIFSQAQNQYRQGQEYFPGSTVVPYSPDTVQGMSGLREQFQNQPIGLDTATSAVTGIAGQGGQNNPFMGKIEAAGNRQNTAGNGVLNDFANTNQSNPYLDQMYNKAAEGTRDNVNSIFSQSGRYGSGAHQGVMGDTMNNLGTQIYGGAYENDANRRFGAAEALGSREAGDINRQFTSANSQAGLGQASNAQAMQASGMLPGLNSYAQSGNQGLVGLGGALENKAGEQVQDSMNRWNFGQNAGWDQLNRYNGVVQPIAGLGGTSTSTQPSQGPSTLQTAAGLGMTAASLFAGSDRRIKTNIKAIGDRGGHRWYSYRYLWDEADVHREGVMAQDVMQTRPDAVETHPMGFLMVNYDALNLTPVLERNYESV